MKIKLVLALLLFSTPAAAQTTETTCHPLGEGVICSSETTPASTTATQTKTDTTCHSTGTGGISCTSETTSDASEVERQRAMTRLGEQLGKGFGNLILNHRVTSYCRKNPNNSVQPAGWPRVECSDWNAVHPKKQKK